MHTTLPLFHLRHPWITGMRPAGLMPMVHTFQSTLKTEQNLALSLPVVAPDCRHARVNAEALGLIREAFEERQTPADLLARCHVLILEDPSCAGLAKIPAAAGTALRLGRDLALLLGIEASPRTEKIHALLGAFNVVLDLLVDEHPLRAQRVMDILPPWLAPEAPVFPVIPHDESDPLVLLALHIARSWLILAHEEGSRHFHLFRSAAWEAVMAEWDSRHLFFSTSLAPLSSVQKRLEAKSAKTMIAHGLAAALDERVVAVPDRFTTMLDGLGRYGGWLDDVADVEEDWTAGRWSSVFVVMMASMDLPTAVTSDTWQTMILHSLGYADRRQRAVNHGVTLYHTLMDHLTHLPGQKSPILALIHDTTTGYLQ